MGLSLLVTVLVYAILTVFGEIGPLGVPCCQGIWLHTVLFEDISLSTLKTWVPEDRKLDSSAVEGGLSLTELQFFIRLLIAVSINCNAAECSCYNEHSIKRLKQKHQKKEKSLHRITGWLRLADASGGHLVQRLLQQGHPEPLAQAHVWVAFKYLQGGREAAQHLWPHALSSASLQKDALARHRFVMHYEERLSQRCTVTKASITNKIKL